MPADYQEMERNFRQFYTLSGKIVVGVGVGGGPFTDLVCEASRLIVIDKDAAAIRAWQERIAAKGLGNRVEVIPSDFCSARAQGDVAYFEFCLHEMDDPALALRHALAMAPEAVVFDHLPNSEWAYVAAEEDKVKRSTEILQGLNCARRQSFRTEQKFATYQQLVDRVSGQGPVALQRVERYHSASSIEIPMTYGLYLLRREF